MARSGMEESAAYMAEESKRKLWLSVGAVALFVIGYFAYDYYSFKAEVRTRRAALELEPILRLETELRVHEKNDMTVTQLVNFKSASKQVKHGLRLNLLPAVYDTSGKLARVTYKPLQWVKLDNVASLVQKIEQKEGFTVHYLGSEKIELPVGEHTFQYQYDVAKPVVVVGGREELNWDVAGYWGTPIKSLVAVVRLPRYVSKESVSFVGQLTGEGGLQKSWPLPKPEAASELKGLVEDDPGRAQSCLIKVWAARPLEPYEHALVRVSWPKGFVVK